MSYAPSRTVWKMILSLEHPVQSMTWLFLDAISRTTYPMQLQFKNIAAVFGRAEHDVAQPRRSTCLDLSLKNVTVQ
jgi:hypothetical protein